MHVWTAVRDRVAVRPAVGLGLPEYSVQPQSCLSEHPALAAASVGLFQACWVTFCASVWGPNGQTGPPVHPAPAILIPSSVCHHPPFLPHRVPHCPTGGSGLQHLPRSGPILLAPEARLPGSRVPLALQPKVPISEQGSVTGNQAGEGQSLSRKASKAQGLACCSEGTCACSHPKQGPLLALTCLALHPNPGLWRLWGAHCGPQSHLPCPPSGCPVPGECNLGGPIARPPPWVSRAPAFPSTLPPKSTGCSCPASAGPAPPQEVGGSRSPQAPGQDPSRAPSPAQGGDAERTHPPLPGP